MSLHIVPEPSSAVVPLPRQPEPDAEAARLLMALMDSWQAVRNDGDSLTLTFPSSTIPAWVEAMAWWSLQDAEWLDPADEDASCVVCIDLNTWPCPVCGQ